MVVAYDIIEKEFPRIEVDTPLSKVVPMFERTSAIVVMDGKSYQGMLIEKDVMRAKLSLDTKAKTMIRHVPKVSSDMQVEEMARLIIESGTYMLPVLPQDTLMGVVTADGLLSEIVAREYGDESIKTYMNSPVTTIGADDTVGKAIKMFKELNISRLPVVDKHRLTGIITMDDIARKIIHPEDKAKGWGKYGEIIAEKKHYLDLPVEGLMVDDPLMMPPESTIKEIIESMILYNLRGMLLGADNQVQGIVTKKDLLRPLAARMEQHQQVFSLQFAGELDDIPNFNKEEARSYALDELQRHQRFLEVGELYLHLKRHKETKQGIPLIYCKVRLSSPRGMFVADEEGWGFMHAIRGAMTDIDRQIRKAERR